MDAAHRHRVAAHRHRVAAHRRLRALAMLALLMLAPSGYAACTALAPFPGLPPAPEIQVTVAGVGDLPLGRVAEVAIARLGIPAEAVPLHLRITLPGTGALTVAPARLGLVPHTEDGHLELALDAAQVAGLRCLVVRRPQRAVVILLERPTGPDTAGTRCLTPAAAPLADALQAAARDGAILRLRPGVYPTGPVRVQGSLHVRFDEGALILGSSQAHDYPQALNQPVFLLQFDGGGNGDIVLEGPGAVHGQGRALFATAGFRKAKTIHIQNARHVVVRGLTLLDGSNWCLSVAQCGDVEIDGVAVISPTHHVWNDAFDVNGCASYRNTDSLAWAEDDAVAVMAHTQANGTVRIERLLAVTGCSGIRVGWKSSFPIGPITLRDCEWLHIGLATVALHTLHHGATIAGLWLEHCWCDEAPGQGPLATWGWEYERGAPRLGALVWDGCHLAQPITVEALQRHRLRCAQVEIRDGAAPP